MIEKVNKSTNVDEFILEYYTEKLGVHLEGLPIGKTIAKGLDKIGLSKVTAALNRAGTSQYAQLGTKVMNRVGVNGYINEVAEEEANIVLNYMFVGDNKMSDLFDGRTQADIWGWYVILCWRNGSSSEICWRSRLLQNEEKR